MMKITSRGQLIELINKKSVETYPVKTDDDRKVLNTIVQVKKTKEFYRIAWGEVKGDNDVFYLWYDEDAEKVELDKETGYWLTKEEKKSSIEDRSKNTVGLNIKEIALYNVKDNLLFINGINTEPEKKDGVNNVQIVAGKTSTGKSEYVFREIVEAIKRDESVLLFSTESEKKEVIKRLVRIIAPEAQRKLERQIDMNEKDLKDVADALHLLENSKLIIDDNYLIDDNYILNKMEEVANSEEGLDLAVVDFLQLSNGNKNRKAIISIHEKMELYRKKLGCKVIITTQLARAHDNASPLVQV